MLATFHLLVFFLTGQQVIKASTPPPRFLQELTLGGDKKTVSYNYIMVGETRYDEEVALIIILLEHMN